MSRRAHSLGMGWDGMEWNGWMDGWMDELFRSFVRSFVRPSVCSFKKKSVELYHESELVGSGDATKRSRNSSSGIK
jgi:hypothetical protein